MTEFDPLELELAAMRPREPSAGLKRRIASQLAAMPLRQPAHGHRQVWRGAAFVGGLLAASLAAVVAWRGGIQNVTPQPDRTLEANLTMAFDNSSPSWWSYRSTLSRAPEALDELLDRHAAETLEHKAGGAPVAVLARWNSEIDSLLGEP